MTDEYSSSTDEDVFVDRKYLTRSKSKMKDKCKMELQTIHDSSESDEFQEKRTMNARNQEKIKENKRRNEIENPRSEKKTKKNGERHTEVLLSDDSEDDAFKRDKIKIANGAKEKRKEKGSGTEIISDNSSVSDNAEKYDDSDSDSDSSLDTKKLDNFSTGTCKLYTLDEDMRIINFFLQDCNYLSSKFIKTYKKMEKEKICPGRSFKSMQIRFSRYILPNLAKYNLDEVSLNKLKGKDAFIKDKIRVANGAKEKKKEEHSEIEIISNSSSGSKNVRKSGDSESDSDSSLDTKKLDNSGTGKYKLYTLDEDLNIINFLIQDYNYLSLKVTKTFIKMANENICPGRSWKSIQKRFTRYILPNLADYNLDEDALNKLKGKVADEFIKDKIRIANGAKQKRKEEDSEIEFISDSSSVSKNARKSGDSECDIGSSSHTKKLDNFEIIKSQHYSLDEDMAIINYLLQDYYYLSSKGKKPYVKMEKEKICPGRNYKSLQKRFCHQILPNLDKYHLDELALKKLRGEVPDFILTEDGEKISLCPGKSQQQSYSKEDDEALINFVVRRTSKRKISVRGDEIWRSAKKKGIVPYRSSSSMRKRFFRRILPNIKNYDIPNDQKEKLLSINDPSSRDQYWKFPQYFTEKEDKELIKFITSEKNYIWTGWIKIWRLAEDQGVCPGKSCKQMLRRMDFLLRPRNIDSLQVEEEIKEKLRFTKMASLNDLEEERNNSTIRFPRKHECILKGSERIRPDSGSTDEEESISSEDQENGHSRVNSRNVATTSKLNSPRLETRNTLRRVSDMSKIKRKISFTEDSEEESDEELTSKKTHDIYKEKKAFCRSNSIRPDTPSKLNSTIKSGSLSEKLKRKSKVEDNDDKIIMTPAKKAKRKENNEILTKLKPIIKKLMIIKQQERLLKKR